MKNKKVLYILIALAVIAAGVVVYFTLDAILDKNSTAENNEGKITSLRFNILEEPLKSADIMFADMEGNRYSLSEFEGKNVIINFWAVFCGPCVTELPDFDKAVENFEERDTIILAINIVEPKDEVNDFIDDIKLNDLGFYMDIDGNAAYTYSVATIPRTLVIDRGGYIIAAAAGAVTYDDLMSLNDLLD